MRGAWLRLLSVCRPCSQLHSLTLASARASRAASAGLVCSPSLGPQRAAGTMAEEYMLQIDGSVMEGGGQILRVATSLSCILGMPVRLHSIRAGRSTPGLRPQHLSGLEMIRDLCEGQLERGEIGSTEVIFTPGKIKGGTHTADTKTAGSVCLLMQVSLPCVLFAAGPTELYLKGGTNAEMAPQIDFTVMVFKPIVEKFSFKFGCDIKTRGYYPRGGGEIVVRTSPVKKLTAINLTDRGTLTKIHGKAFVAGVLPYKVAKDMAAAALRCIRREIKDVPVNVQAVQEPKEHAVGNGTGIVLFAETSTGCIFAGSALGKRGVPAEKVAGDAADMLLRNLRHGGCVDEFLQDQLIIFMALAEGVSKIRTGPVTLHTETAIHFAEQLTKATFSVKKSDDQEGDTDNYIIECQGIGLINTNL